MLIVPDSEFGNLKDKNDKIIHISLEILSSKNFGFVHMLVDKMSELYGYFMISPIPGQDLPPTYGSKRHINFQCDCGNIFKTMWSSYTRNQTKSCGSCKLFIWKKSGIIKYNHLTLIPDINLIEKLTGKCSWQCDCGNTKIATVLNVIEGRTQSCGCAKKESLRKAQKTQKQYGTKTASEWINFYPLLVAENLPDFWSAGSSRKFKFFCKCGNQFIRKFSKYNSESATCGKCNLKLFTKGEIVGDFVYDDIDEELKPNSTQKRFMLCSCGRRELIRIREAVTLYKKICGNCNLISKEEIENKKYGKLRMKFPKDIKYFSSEKVLWVCDCGNEASIGAHSVFKGLTNSCGNCRKIIQEWYINNKTEIKSLKCPLLPGPILGGILAFEEIKTVSEPFKAECHICKKIYYPRLHGIKDGESLTCGCTSNSSSLPQREIASIISSFGIEAELEFKLQQYEYDIYIPSSKLLVEYHGLKWHATLESRKRDFDKYKTAIDNNFQLISIFEDEWRHKKDKVINLILNRLGLNSDPKKLRPKKCEIRKIPRSLADPFYEKYHYIGQCKSNINYGAYYQDELIACSSFKHPTRQSKYSIELIRMTSHPDFRVHGIWSLLLQKYIAEYSPKSIVSFSDNRLFTGKVYEKIGFKYNGDVTPDYYWVRDKKRYHKSGLRKPPGHIGTETELRLSQGYIKVWDLGKKRWTMYF